MSTIFRNTALALAAAGLAVPAVPAAAADYGRGSSSYVQVAQHSHDRGRHDGWDRDSRDRYGYDTRYYGTAYHSEPVYRDTRMWRGDDGRYYCRKRDGSTGLVIGAVAGALVGRSVDTHGDRTAGTVIGGILGALIGQQVDGGTTCR
jgi:uncharacterized protein YcfJ